MTCDMPHNEWSALLPWYANGSLDGEERSQLEAHLAQCLVCRGELAELDGLASRIASRPVPSSSPAAAYGRLLGALEQRGTPMPNASIMRPQQLVGTKSYKRAGSRLARYGGWALAAAVLLVLMPTEWQPVSRMAEPNFKTLADRKAGAPYIEGGVRLVFAKHMSLQAIDELLGRVGGKRIGGPGSGGEFTARITGNSNRDAAVAYLRGQAGVLFVQPATAP